VKRLPSAALSLGGDRYVIPALVSILALVSPPTAKADPPPEMLIKLVVDPMAAPQPALRYTLLPELRELTQGNPIPNYLKCILDQDFSSPDETLGKAALKQADRAARMDKPDWQILPKLKVDGVSLLLPDLQKMRQLATELQKRFRDEITQRRFNDALVTAKTMFALSRHMGEHPTLIGELVGIAIAAVTITPLEEMLEQPGCPNLYWALTYLPAPFVSLRAGLEGERIFLATELRDLDDKNPMTTAQLKKLITYIDRLLEVGRNEKKTIDVLREHTQDEKYMASARTRLIELAGIPADRLDTFSPYQVVLLNEKLQCEIERDEAIKLSHLPTWEAIPRMDAVSVPKTRSVFFGFLPAVQKIRRAQGRLEQRIALLRHVEAIRMHAAANGGKVPAKLADVDGPLPVDPFTGKPFRYEVVDGVAHVRGSPPKGDEKIAAYNLHYEIIIRK
jgi:hypothetical protein